MLYPIAKGKIPSNADIKSIKLDYAGGFVSQDKVIPVEILLKKKAPTLKKVVVIEKKERIINEC